MIERKYRVIEVMTNKVLASGMEFDIALAFIRGYRVTYFAEPLNLMIAEEERAGQHDGTAD